VQGNLTRFEMVQIKFFLVRRIDNDENTTGSNKCTSRNAIDPIAFEIRRVNLLVVCITLTN